MRGNHITLSFGLEKVYDDANFLLHEADKVGIVGVNGAGKTTLFQVILGKVSLDSGQLVLSKKKRIGYLPQEVSVEDPDMTVLDFLSQARPIQTLNQRLMELYEKVALEESEKEQKKLLQQIAITQEKLEYYDCYQAETILFELIEKMEIELDLLDLKLKDLSGGQKSKIAFARLLYSNPEILLLDEPTNHLDITTRKFVTEYLKKYHGTVLVISHDIEFLNAIVTDIMYIDKQTKKISMYHGDYGNFMKKLEQERESKMRKIEQQEKEEQALREFILQYSNSSGKRKRIAQSREKLLQKKMKDHIESDKKQKQVKFHLQPKKEGSKIPIKVNNISFHYDQANNLFHNLSFMIQNKERFLIVGENGVGKSTLLKLLIGELKPNEGNIWFGNKTEFAYYAQQQELLDHNKTILENVDRSGYSEKELRTILGSFLFYGDDVFKKVGVLSPGERARISLCMVMLQQANLLLLDEPTNHLDPETQKIIGENFKSYEGTIILVSHDPSFIESIGIDRMLVLPSGKIMNYSLSTLLEYTHPNDGHLSIFK